jgi:tetratricopeptide (TPR) repeat protein
MNMTPLDLKACYPRIDRDWGYETEVSGMGVAIRDTYPRLLECSNDYFFREGKFEDEMVITLKVEPDHTVSVSYETSIDDPIFRTCVEDTLDMIELPEAVDPAGQTVQFTYNVTNKGDNSLRISASRAGTIVGTIRTNALQACACFEDYKNEVPEDMAFAFVLGPDSPYPSDVRPIGEIKDEELASCLANHLSETKIRTYDSELKGKYRFKTENSRARSADRLASDAAEMHNRGEYQAALQTYEEALGIEKNHVGSLLGMSQVYLDIEEYNNALESAEKAIANGAEDRAIAHYRVARSHLNLGNIDAAREAADESLKLDDESFHAWHVMALIELKQDNLKKALRAAKKSEKLNPDYMPIYIAKARVLRAMDQPDDALAALKTATKLDLVDPNAYSSLAQFYMEIDEFQKALDAYETARERGLDNSYVYYNMAVCHQNLGNSGKAKKLACKAATKRPPLQQAMEWCER